MIELMYNPKLLDCINEQDLQPFYAVDQFEYLKPIEQQFLIIKQEWDGRTIDRSLYQNFENLQHWLVNSPQQWEIVNLKKIEFNSVIENSKIVDYQGTVAEDAMPRTLDILKSNLGNRLLDVTVSCIAPGTKIHPHRGRFYNSLRAHLGLQIPAGDCKIKVSNETRSWHEGKLLIFDDRMTHEVWNNTDQTRVVLIFDFIPDPIPGFFVPAESYYESARA